ncbi:hypothetical protein HMPREF0514_11511 [Lactobacillus paragasseri JV-V03]|uniref:Uncharacterized protein n=1 Tax=Lactobacillus paragasseri JV-V03 TaxID=525326 RepID=A0AA86ZYX5_9LACO|nr:acid shock protein [Lactobacillus paragasseri]EFJ69441.1 hypothetical protein HMPREF0514_11511 [Lactobacillus paragasseri JV-V03]MDK7068291.1 acid shock protein [Lactobacillus paragasseri]
MKKVITTIGVVAMGLSTLSFTAHSVSAAKVSTNRVLESKSVSGSWQNTILGPEQGYIGSGGGYSRGPNPQYGYWH